MSVTSREDNWKFNFYKLGPYYVGEIWAFLESEKWVLCLEVCYEDKEMLIEYMKDWMKREVESINKLIENIDNIDVEGKYLYLD